jgi:alkylhydroperoxidase family enzyme
VDPATRRAAYSGTLLPDPLGGYLQTIRRHAYRVEDSDVDRLHDAGYTDDQIFEVTIAAAFGAGAVRLRAGLTALNEALA